MCFSDLETTVGVKEKSLRELEQPTFQSGKPHRRKLARDFHIRDVHCARRMSGESFPKHSSSGSFRQAGPRDVVYECIRFGVFRSLQSMKFSASERGFLLRDLVGLDSSQ